MIRFEKNTGKWLVLDHEGKKILGRHDTKMKAERQLRAIEAAKSERGRR